MNDILRGLIGLLFGNRPDPDYKTYPHNTHSPFKNDEDRHERDPLWRHGIIRGLFTAQFLKNPPVVLWRFIAAHLNN